MKSVDKKRKMGVSIELAAAAQAAYMQAEKKEQQTQQGKPANIGLQPGWGGKGR